jgi:hypothetical protein
MTAPLTDPHGPNSLRVHIPTGHEIIQHAELVENRLSDKYSPATNPRMELIEPGTTIDDGRIPAPGDHLVTVALLDLTGVAAGAW